MGNCMPGSEDLLQAPGRRGQPLSQVASTPGQAARVDTDFDETVSPRRPGFPLRDGNPGRRGTNIASNQISTRAACPGVKATSRNNGPFIAALASLELQDESHQF